MLGLFLTQIVCRKIDEEDYCIIYQIICSRADTSDMAVEEQEVIVGIVTDIDLLQYISRAEQGSGSGSESPNKGENPQC